jgi:hypothetical protein
VTSRTPTPPSLKIPPLAAKPPREGERTAKIPDKEAIGHGPTPPSIPIPKTPPPDKPHPNTQPRAATPPRGQRLIVPQAERADAEAQLDQALSDLTVERNGRDEGPDDKKVPKLRPPARVRIPQRPATDDPEITVEDGGGSDQSEPEISIESVVEIEAEDPLNVDEPVQDIGTAQTLETLEPAPLIPTKRSQFEEPSQPEILVVEHGRPISANDTSLVAGSIEQALEQTIEKSMDRAERKIEHSLGELDRGPRAKRRTNE